MLHHFGPLSSLSFLSSFLLSSSLLSSFFSPSSPFSFDFVPGVGSWGAGIGCWPATYVASSANSTARKNGRVKPISVTPGGGPKVRPDHTLWTVPARDNRLGTTNQGERNGTRERAT